MKVLSLFDGMACGMLAMQTAEINVSRYVAFEIDKYAIQTSSHNFPMIEHRGDVFHADFTEFQGFDFLVGGSPCTYWSIAQKNNRETEASGMGWELFSQYVRALREAQPKYFIYENNKSMSNAIRESITRAFGFEPICINSALVSAQNRQRLYWVGKRNLNGTYSRVCVNQPEDRGILLKDVLDRIGAKELTEREIDYMVRNSTGKYNNRWSYLQKPSQNDKALCITANISKGVPHNSCAEPVCLNSKSGRGGVEGLQPSLQDRIYSIDGKHTAVTTAFMPNVAVPIRVGTHPRDDGEMIDHQQTRIYSTDAKGVTLCGNGGGMGAKTGLYAVPCKVGEVGNGGQGNRIYSVRGKSVAQTAQSGGIGSNTGLYAFEVPMYAQPVEWDENGKPTKAISGADGKTYPVYEVKDGLTTIKGKEYPIKLEDGFYIFRKLTVSECKRLQTVPEWYAFPVSDSQAYKMLGNGWTVEVIAHLIESTQINEIEDEQLNLFKESV